MIVTVSCRGKVVEEPVLIEYINDVDNGLIKSEKHDDFEIILTYKPTDLIVKQQSDRNSEYDSLIEVYSKYLYFTLTVSKSGKDLESFFARDLGTFASRIEYLTTRFSQNITLLTTSGSISIEDYLYVRSFGKGPSEFLVVFKKAAKDEFQVIINGVDLGFGKTEFTFDQRDLDKIPQLKF